MALHPDFAAAVNQQIDLKQVVSAYRANNTALRRLYQSRPTRNVLATQKAISRRTDEQRWTELSLAIAGYDALIGWLVEEAKLLIRLVTAKNLGQTRPELQARLRTARRHIKTLSA